MKEAEIYHKILPGQFYQVFSAQGKRPDGRGFEEFRPTSLDAGVVSTAEGSVIARLGNTLIVCGIKAEVAEPLPESPKLGFIVPTLELGPLCSSTFKSGPPNDLSQVCSEKLFTYCKRMFDLEQLCIQPGKAVWVIYADLICINYDGNVLDCAYMALSGALLDVRLPRASFVEEEGTVRASWSDCLIPLIWREPTLYFTSFGTLESEEDLLVVDPNAEEEGLLSATLTLGVRADGTIGLMCKEGGASWSMELMRKAISLAQQRSLFLKKLIEQSKRL